MAQLLAVVVVAVGVLAEMTSTSPVYNLQPAYITATIGSTGRNIRNLPCISRKSNQSGVCMFAIDCLKANGTHLGTCIDRFYFGSCCHIEPLQEITENTIDTALIPSREPPHRITTTTTTTSTTTTTMAASPTTPNDTDAYKITTFQSVNDVPVNVTTTTTTSSKPRPPQTTPKPSTTFAVAHGSNATHAPNATRPRPKPTKPVRITKPILDVNTTSTAPLKTSTTTTTTTTSKPTKKPTILATTSSSKPTTTTTVATTAAPTSASTSKPIITTHLPAVATTPPSTTITTTTLSNDVLVAVNNASLTKHPDVNGNPATNQIETATWSDTQKNSSILNTTHLETPSTTSTTTTTTTTTPTTPTTTVQTETTPDDWVPVTDGWVLLPSVTTILPEESGNTTTTEADGSNNTISSSSNNSSAEANATMMMTTTPMTSSVSTTALYGASGVNMSDFTDVCGRRMVPEGRIVGGEKSAFGRWPWQISLRQWRTSTYLHKCGAALLNENWAITAAHCVDNVPPSDLLLRLGEHDLSTEAEPYLHQERRVQIVASHPQFDPRTFEYDLALLRFYEPVAFQPNIIPVCVPHTDENFVGRNAHVTGWGRLYEDGPLPSVLQEVSVPVINNTVCESMYRSAGYIEHIPNIFICAGWRRGGFDSCEGDSGGPMVIQRTDKRFILAGVISWGIGCAEPNQPGVYTRISEFRDWINQILQF